MPKYRALYTKIIDSFDFNEMPDDFVRLTWVMLPLILDSEGRGIDSPMWVRAKMYPLRNGIIDSEIRRAFDWFAEHQMIVRYQVNGRAYFHIPTWKEYQRGTQKEAASVLPPPPALRSSSGVSPEKVVAAVYESESASEYESASASKQELDEFGCPLDPNEELETDMSNWFIELTGISPYDNKKWLASCQNMVRNKVTREILQKAVGILRDKIYAISGPWSVEKTAISEAANGSGEPRGETLVPSETGRL